VMNAIADVVPELFGGAADLTSSTKTIFKPARASTQTQPVARLLRRARVWHVRGGQWHGGSRRLIPFGSTFFTFSDYCKPAMRLAALMKIRSLFVFTHDSIGLGEDGPTHQPVEQLMMLRAVPDLTASVPPTPMKQQRAGAWALERTGPASSRSAARTCPSLTHPK